MCPFLDLADPRCSAHLTLANISSAYAHCAARFGECPVFRVVLSEHPELLDPHPQVATGAALRVAS